MFQNLCQSTNIQLTAVKKIAFKCQGYDKPWDTSTHPGTYFKYLDNFKAKRNAQNIHTSEDKKIQVEIARMGELNLFSHDNMVQWEKQHTEDQNSENITQFFVGKYVTHTKLSCTTAGKHKRFSDTANQMIEQEVVAEAKPTK